jgi:hypothetical protein
MKKLMDITNAPSLMEEKARKFAGEEKREEALAILPESQEEILAEINTASRQLVILSKGLKETRELLESKEKQFDLLANYKYILQRKLIIPIIITKSPATLEREKKARLFEKMTTLSPEQLDKLKEIKL